MATISEPETGIVAISAHRGGSEAGSPATYEAYKHALTTGAEYVEFDIRKTLDGILVVYHDARAHHHDASAEHAGPLVSGISYDELCDRIGYVAPRVDEVMNLLAGKMTGHLDLKEIGYEAEVIELATETFGAGNFIATTLEDQSIVNIKRDFPQVRTALSLGRDLAELPRHRWPGVRRSEIFPLPRIRACGADWVAVNYKLARLGVLRTCAHAGIGTMVWTVDSDPLIDQFITDHRVEVLITNRPEHAVRRRAEIRNHARAVTS